MKVLVTGASGILGAATADALGRRGDVVTVLQRRPSGLPFREFLADVAERDALRAAVRGQDAVVHLAAKVNVTGPWPEYERVNVEGTRRLLDAAAGEGVARFVYVSSPSVAHSGRSIVGGRADPADPVHARGSYARSKALAERLALTADALPVVAIRPHLVWGPGDQQLVGRIAERARAGRLAFVGNGTALIDTTYVTNAAHAIVAALDRCEDLRGQAFVVTNGEPRPLAEIVGRVCRAAGVSASAIHVPSGVAWAAGAAVEAVWAALGRAGSRLGDPPMTRFVAEQLSTAHWFDQRQTRAALRWSPSVSLDEGFERLARWYAGRSESRPP